MPLSHPVLEERGAVDRELWSLPKTESRGLRLAVMPQCPLFVPSPCLDRVPFSMVATKIS